MTTPEAFGRHRRIAAWLHIGAGAFMAALLSMLWVCAVLLAPAFQGTFFPGLVSVIGRAVALALALYTLFAVFPMLSGDDSEARPRSAGPGAVQVSAPKAKACR